MELQPYIFFYGRCAEALEFYKKVFNGTYEAMRVKDSPMKDEMPADSGDLIMHASFKSAGVNFMAADGREIKAVDPEAGNIALSLEATDTTAGERVFKALSEGGKVGMAIDEAFWGGRFGMVTDKFGTEWLMTLP